MKRIDTRLEDSGNRFENLFFLDETTFLEPAFSRTASSSNRAPGEDFTGFVAPREGQTIFKRSFWEYGK